MILERVKHKLHSQYQIDTFIDLAEFDQLPKGKLYTALRRLHKEVFADNERVVFVATGTLKKSYADLPHDIIISLQEYVQHHDIPHFFIIVVTDIKSVPDELEFVRKQYNPQEAVPMPHILIHE
jgi:hypothetical protein